MPDTVGRGLFATGQFPNRRLKLFHFAKANNVDGSWSNTRGSTGDSYGYLLSKCGCVLFAKDLKSLFLSEGRKVGDWSGSSKG